MADATPRRGPASPSSARNRPWRPAFSSRVAAGVCPAANPAANSSPGVERQLLPGWRSVLPQRLGGSCSSAPCQCCTHIPSCVLRIPACIGIEQFSSSASLEHQPRPMTLTLQGGGAAWCRPGPTARCVLAKELTKRQEEQQKERGKGQQKGYTGAGWAAKQLVGNKCQDDEQNGRVGGSGHEPAGRALMVRAYKTTRCVGRRR